MKKIFIVLLLLISLNTYSQNNTVIRVDSIEFNLNGDWNLTNQREESGQFSFSNKKTKVAITISARDKTKFEFYKENQTEFETVSAFYNWDVEYWKTSKDCKTNEIKRDVNKKYIIWSLKVPKGGNYVLYGIKSNHLIGINIDQKSLPQKDEIELLENIYQNLN